MRQKAPNRTTPKSVVLEKEMLTPKENASLIECNFRETIRNNPRCRRRTDSLCECSVRAGIATSFLRD